MRGGGGILSIKIRLMEILKGLIFREGHNFDLDKILSKIIAVNCQTKKNMLFCIRVAVEVCAYVGLAHLSIYLLGYKLYYAQIPGCFSHWKKSYM